MPLYLLFASLYYPLCLPHRQVKLFRERLKFHPVKPAALKNPPPEFVMDKLVDKPRPLGACEIGGVVGSHDQLSLSVLN